MGQGKGPDLRVAAHEDFGRDWTKAIEAGQAMKSAFEHLSGSIAKMAGHGSHQMLTMPDNLVQEWWVVFQERNGDMIPRHPELPPPGMKHEDEIVDEAVA